MRQRKNTLEDRIKAWWLRNFIFSKDELIKIKIEDKVLLFEVVRVSEGMKYIYLGNNLFKPIKMYENKIN